MPDGTLVGAVVRSLESEMRSSEGVAPPAAILWPDPERQWTALIARLRASLPPVFVLGEYRAEERTGPAIWLRCVVDRTVEAAPPANVCPIFYLPGVSRDQLRAGVDCPVPLQPLIELQYRGTTWHQKNGRPWTVEAFLTSVAGLDLALDARTREAILRALSALTDVELSSLRGRRLDADDFDGLTVGDPVRDLLKWMANPKSFRAGLGDGEWKSFCSLVRAGFGLSPDDGDVDEAATLLAKGGGKWEQLWQRFCEAPGSYAGVVSALRKAQHNFVTAERNPGENERLEGNLRKDLEALLSMPHAEACAKVAALEKEHGKRRASVWASLGLAPLALALEPLARLAQTAQRPVAGANAEAVAAEYAENGWRCDRALLDALSSPAQPADHDLVGRVARILYEPWADVSARNLQDSIAKRKQPSRVKDSPDESGNCILFVDGLRFDLGVALRDRLEARGLVVRMQHRIAPLPTVTPTGKPETTPIRHLIRAGDDASDFTPVFAGDEPVVAPKMREVLRANGIAVLASGDPAGPNNDASVAWIEVGQLDSKGHDLGVDLLKHVEEELERIVDQVTRLTELGWRVKVVTDHGWLLLPGGLPKHQLPAYLTESKWSRCAVVKPGTVALLPSYPWHWNPQVAIVSPPGIHSFKAGVEYAHGGISLQECVVPELMVKGNAPTVMSTIEKLEWRGMRCRVVVKQPVEGLRVDLRTNRKDPGSRVANAEKEVVDGRADLVVPDDRDEGKAAFAVLLDAGGNVVAYQSTTIGGE